MSAPEGARPPQPASRVARRIGRYLVTGRIGQGGMGRVYRAFDETLERELAVKTLTGEGSLELEQRQRFAIEAKAAARLQHPNIITVYELGEQGGVPFIAMELLPGADLETLMRTGEPLLLAEKLEVLIQVCRGLHFAHEHRIVHRDVKPSNIRVLEDGGVKIMDFGIAKLGASGVTKTGMTVGTVHYMSPEQVLGKPLDGRSDVFSVGVILYELLVGARPFGGEGPTEALYKIVHEPAPRLLDAVPEREALQAILDQALAKDREQRYSSAARLADDLGRVLAEHRGRAAFDLPAEAQETVSLSQRLLKEGQLEESLNRLREVTAQHPQAIEARRALRWATREEQRRREAAPAVADDFAELALTFQSAPTELGEPPTRALWSGGDAVAPAAAGLVASASRTGPWLVALGGLAVLTSIVVTSLLIRRPQASPAASAPPATQPDATAAPAPTTPIAPASSEARRSRPSPAAIEAVAGDAAAPGPATPAPSLPPAAPPGELSVSSSYPVEVVWQGRSLGKAQSSPRVSLGSGSQSVTLVSGEHFLKMTLQIEVPPGGVVEVKAPPLGRLNVRATPDNCEVLVDGSFLDYPPVLDRPIAAGAHTVTFKWPDGARSDHGVEVVGGSPAYVMGRKR